MAVKAGQILFDADGFVVDRVQTGGVSNLNIPQEKIYEMGNSSSVTTVRDTAELSFDVESFDVVPELEAIVTAANPTAAVDGDMYDFKDAVPIYVVSPFKSALNAYDVVKGIAVPHLSLSQVAYKFGVTSNATQTFTFQGDTVNYIPGSPYYEEFSVTAGANQTYNLAHTAIQYVEQGHSLYVLGACAVNPTTKAYKRLHIVTNYTNTSTSITVLDNLSSLGYTKLRVVYGSATAATYGTGVHQGVGVKPGAVRGKDICIYVSDGAATPTLVQWTGVQSVDVNWQVQLEADREFCNAKVLGYDYDVPTVNGSITVRPLDPADLFTKIAQVANVATNKVAGLYSSAPLETHIVINDPETGAPIKTLVVPDARFTLPNVQGRVQQKAEVTFNFESDGGLLEVWKGAAG